MCLQTVMQQFTKDNNFGIGYKKVNTIHGRPNSYETPNQCETYQAGKWLKANTKSKLYTNNYVSPYRSGFHIFLNKADAEKYTSGSKVIRVRYRGVTTFGLNKTDYDAYGDCVIASEMFIEKNQ